MAGKTRASAASLGIRATCKITDRKVQAAVRSARDIKRQMKELEAKLAPHVSTIKAAMGDAEEAYVGDRKVATWIETVKTSVSTTKVKQEYPEIARKCSIDQTVRTFKLMDEDA